MMPSIDQPVERPSAEAAAATEAAHRLATDAALVFQKQQQRFKRCAAASRNHREELAAMTLEFETNRTVLDGLTDRYGVFVFTGGAVPTARWDLAAMTTYLEHPCAADRISTGEIDRYRNAAGAIDELGGAAAGAGPRTLRCRHDIGDRFGRAASEIRVLTGTLEAEVAKARGGFESHPRVLGELQRKNRS
jgi:hypothetical protein